MEGEGSGNRELVKKEGDEEKSRERFVRRRQKGGAGGGFCLHRLLGGAERKPTPVFGWELGDGGIFLKECTVSRYRNLAS